MKYLIFVVLGWFCAVQAMLGSTVPTKGVASWYGEEHRGRLMANGKKFDPDKYTAASWFYPLGTKVRVTANTNTGAKKSVVVTVTDRGPAMDLVREGRIIDLGHAPFKALAHPDKGLVPIKVERIR
jgi:rare lipoprotein A